MAVLDHDDFRVVLKPRGDGTYDCRATDPDGTVHTGVFELPLGEERLAQAVLGLAARAAGRARSVAAPPAPPPAPPEAAPGTPPVASGPVTRDVQPSRPPEADAEELGGALAGALLAGEVGSAYDRARTAAYDRERGLRLTLSLAAAPALLSVPWELMYRRPRFLANQRRTPFVRHLDVPVGAEPPAIVGPVRVLGVIASPDDCTPLDVAAERHRVEQAVAPVVEAGRAVLDWLDPATPRRLREALRDGTYHVLHFVGHSDFTDAGQGVLYLEDGSGGHALLDDTALANLLADQSTLRLVVLNSCEGARTTLTDPFAGVATTLVQLGVPAVVAMQFEISDAAAILFAEELYTNLIGRQSPIDVAVAEARKAIFIEQGTIEWATPVLFMADPDAELFRFAEPDAAPVSDTPAAALAPPPPPPVSAPPAAAMVDSTASRPRRNRRWLALAGAAAAVAIGAGVVAVVGSGADDDDGAASASTTAATAATAPPGTALSASVVPAATAPAATATPTDAATAAAAAQSFTGTITEPDGRAEHALELVAGQLIYVDSPPPCGSQLSYRLVPPAGTNFGGAPTVCTPMGRVEVPATGTWTLQVDGYGGGTGPYAIEVRPVPDDTVTAIEVGGSVEGEIRERGERHVATFEANSGDLVYVRGAGDCGTLLDYRLRSPSDTQVGANPYTCNDIGRVALAESGEYRIVIEGPNGERGTYALDVLPVPDDRVDSVAVGDRLTGELTQPGEEHQFKFDAAAGDRVRIDGLGPCGAQVDYVVRSPSDVQVGPNPYACNDLDTQVLAESGEYTVVVRGAGDAIGAYDLMLLPGD